MAVVEQLLVVGPAWVGDMVMAQSLFKTLVARDATVRVTVLAPAWTRPLLERMPEVAGAVAAPFVHGRLDLAARRRLGRALAGQSFSRAIVLPGAWKAALTPYWARIPHRTGYRGEWRYGLLTDIRPLDRRQRVPTVERFVALGLPADAAPPADVPCPRLTTRTADVAAALARHGLAPPDSPVLALAPGAEYGPAKQWPIEHFATLARHQRERGWAVWLFGSARDRPAAAAIDARAGGGCCNLAGSTGLDEAIDLLSLATAVVSNDSGLMHVAAALDRPLVALYGSSSAIFTPPLSRRAEVLSLGLDCSPCFQRECPLGHLNCLRELSPEMVIAALERLPGRPADHQASVIIEA